MRRGSTPSSSTTFIRGGQFELMIDPNENLARVRPPSKWTTGFLGCSLLIPGSLRTHRKRVRVWPQFAQSGPSPFGQQGPLTERAWRLDSPSRISSERRQKLVGVRGYLAVFYMQLTRKS